MSSSTSSGAVRRPGCSRCGRPAVAWFRSAQLRLCRLHFAEYLERKVLRVLRRAGVSGGCIAVAVSGGKDSVAMVSILSRVAPRLGVRLVGVHIDLGLGAYSEASRSAALEACRAAGIPCLVIPIAEILGMSVAQLAARARRPVCSVCGLVKRYVLNVAATVVGADYVATGHTLDDVLAYAVKSFLQQDASQLSKLAPATERLEGAVARLKPLYEVYEKETLIYVLSEHLKFLEEKCPRRPHAPLEDEVKLFLGRVEDQHPGFKMMAAKKLEEAAPRYAALTQHRETARCPACGMISAGGLCGFCRLTARVLGEPMGARVREAVSRLAESQSIPRCRAASTSSEGV